MNKIAKPTMQQYDRYVLVCVGDRCAGQGQGQAVYEELKARLKLLNEDNAESRLNVAG